MERRELTHNWFTLENAIEVAEEFHKGQKDRSNKPYMEHLHAVMNQLQGTDAKMAGVLHDIVEDTTMTTKILFALGVPKQVLEAIVLVSHDTNFKGTEEEYFADITRVATSGNQIAIDVKWADLTHNSDRTRISRPNKWDIKRWEKYTKAKQILGPFVSDYLKTKYQLESS